MYMSSPIFILKCFISKSFVYYEEVLKLYFRIKITTYISEDSDWK